MATLRCLVVLLTVVVVGCRGQSAEAPASRQSRITVSRETTRITEPLRSDGFVDYAAALNQQLSDGVTPENNSSVLMLQAMGPQVIDERIRADYIRMLGIPPLPVEGAYFVPSDAQFGAGRTRGAPGEAPGEEERQKWWEDLSRAMGRPWSKEDLPSVADWLEANERPLELIVEASKCPRRYDPLIATGDPPLLMTAFLPVLQVQRDAARALVIRAMHRLHAGRAEEAWQDALACHRLSRLAAQGGTLIDMLVAIAIDGTACSADRAILAYGGLTADQARAMHGDLERLPPLSDVPGAVDRGERYMFLDSVQALADKGLTEFDRVAGGQAEDSALSRFLSGAATRALNWDVILQTGNAWYDRFVAAQRKATRAERAAALDELERDLRELLASIRSPKSLMLSMLSGRKAISERVGEILVGLLLPATRAATEAEERGRANFEVVRWGFLLAAYRADNGMYPDQLADLVPQYTPRIPLDPFSGQPLKYTRQDDGYLLYSVGVNGKDDGGLGYDDRPQAGGLQGDYDDLVVRVPLQPYEPQPR